MRRLSKLRPSPALVVALAALVAATSGAALALPGKNSVQRNDIKNGAINAKKIKRGAIGSKQIKGKSIRGNRLKDKTVKAKQIADDAVTSAQVGANALNTSDLSDVKAFGSQLVTATDGTDADAARAAAAKVELFRKGQLAVYGKCYRDTTADVVFADVYIETSANGALFDGDDELNGGSQGDTAAYLDTNTPEDERQLETSTDAGLDDTDASEGEFMAIAPDGTKLVGQLSTAAKNGSPAAGNGPFGAGNVCLFNGEISG